MKVFKLLLVLFLLFSPLVVPLFVPTVTVSAAPLLQEETPPNILDLIAEGQDALYGMAYVALLMAAGFNFAKERGWLQDKQASTATALTSVILVGLFAAIKFFFPDFNLLVFDDYASLLVDAGGAFTPLAVILLNLISKLFHTQLLRGLPLVGFSYTRLYQDSAKG